MMLKFTLIAITSMTVSAGGVAMAEAPPSDAEILGSKTVGVQPILMTGSSREGSLRDVAMAMSLITEAKGVKPSGAALNLGTGDGGFGFGGSSSADDMGILHYGIVLGSLVTNKGTETWDKGIKYLEAGRERLASLTPETVKAVDQFIAAAKGGGISTEALANIQMAAEAGIAVGNERGHGYLASGVWLGISLMAAALDDVSLVFSGMAEPLAKMLDEDASFGGSDRAIAKEMRAVAGALAGPKGAGRSDVFKHVMAVTEITPDPPKEPAPAAQEDGAIKTESK